MGLYCGIDLHSNNHVIVVIDEKDAKLLERRVPNELAQTLQCLSPFRRRLKGIAVESTFNWYWLVDGLQAYGYPVVLANPGAMQQYQGLKSTDDRHDAFWLAHMLRLGILPTGYIYPREQRAVRDLLRKRMQLVSQRATHVLSIQNQVWRHTGQRVSANEIKAAKVNWTATDPHVTLAVQANFTLLRALQRQISSIERTVLKAMALRPEFAVLQSVPGIGKILALTIMLETGDIGRFAGVGNYASYCRCVKSERLSNDKKKGEGNRKSGNKYLSWAFSEAAHFCVRLDTNAKRYFERKRQRTNAMVAIRAVAHKLARACYYLLRDQVPYESARLFAR